MGNYAPCLVLFMDVSSFFSGACNMLDGDMLSKGILGHCVCFKMCFVLLILSGISVLVHP